MLFARHHRQRATSEQPTGAKRILPSLLCAPPLTLASAVTALADAPLHIDVMDGRMVPNFGFSPATVKALAALHEGPLDVHLMVEDPEAWAPRFVAQGATAITVHLEMLSEPLAALSRLRGVVPQLGLSLRPETPVSAMLPIVQAKPELLDSLLVLGVAPGFGGQLLKPTTPTRLGQARALRSACGGRYAIVVDGGVTAENLPALIVSGADRAVVGQALFADGLTGLTERRDHLEHVAAQAALARSAAGAVFGASAVGA